MDRSMLDHHVLPYDSYTDGYHCAYIKAHGGCVMISI